MKYTIVELIVSLDWQFSGRRRPVKGRRWLEGSLRRRRGLRREAERPADDHQGQAAGGLENVIIIIVVIIVIVIIIVIITDIIIIVIVVIGLENGLLANAETDQTHKGTASQRNGIVYEGHSGNLTVS
jgi:hypothetical protein